MKHTVTLHILINKPQDPYQENDIQSQESWLFWPCLHFPDKKPAEMLLLHLWKQNGHETDMESSGVIYE